MMFHVANATPARLPLKSPFTVGFKRYCSG